MDQTSITAAGAIDTFLVLLIGIGPKLALVPFLTITASLDPAARQQVQRKMLTTAATVALILMVLGELLRTLLHFSIGSLSIAGGVILLVLAVGMALGPPTSTSPHIAGKNPMQLAHYPLAVPYLLNPVGIVSLITISAEAKSLSVFAGDQHPVFVEPYSIGPVEHHSVDEQDDREDAELHREDFRVLDRRDRRATGLQWAGFARSHRGCPALKHWHAGGSCKDPPSACSRMVIRLQDCGIDSGHRAGR
jgi:small neutral amino acid transporter SnatA (MarC family)